MQVFHGKIITCDKNNTVANYLVEREGRIAYIGDELPMQYEDIPPIELGNKACIPAFVDTHNHYSSFSIFHSIFPIPNTKSNASILEHLREYAKDSKENFIVGFGASEYGVEEKHLILKEQLDAICPDKPLLVIKKDGHSGVANSVLVEMMKSRAVNIRGYNAATGELTQESFSIAMEIANKNLSTKRVIEAMMDTFDFLAGRGIGVIHSASGLGFVRDYDFDMERSVAKGLDNGMQMRVAYQTDDVPKAVKKELNRIVYVDLDGTFDNRDAYLTEDYASVSNRGISFCSDEDLLKFCLEANRAGKQIALHAVGDAAFDQAAFALSAALEDYPRYDHRHMILHASLPTDRGLKICAKYGIMLSTSFNTLLNSEAEYSFLVEHLSEERVKNINPLKRCLDYGVEVCFNSDAPSTEPNPIMWIANACNHIDKEQSVDIKDALKMATYYGARACFDERERGTLEMGKRCDIVILDANPYEVPTEELYNLRVLQLYLGGKPYEHTRSGAMATMLRGMFPQ